MLGYIIKDFLLIKQNLRSLVILLSVFVFLQMSGDVSMTFVLPFMAVMLFITTFSYDEFNGWDAFAATLPGSRRLTVASKYVATLLLIAVVFVITFILNIGIGLFKQGPDVNLIISELIGTFISVLLIMSLLYPVTYKYGIQKGRIFLFVFAFLFVGGMSLLGTFADFEKLPAPDPVFLNNYLPGILLAATLLLLSGSYMLSVRFYSRKDF